MKKLCVSFYSGTEKGYANSLKSEANKVLLEEIRFRKIERIFANKINFGDWLGEKIKTVEK